MTKCLSCGHFRHDLELNCPKCGSFYSTIVDDFDDEPFELSETKTHTPHLNTPKHRFLAILVVILILIIVLFL